MSKKNSTFTGTVTVYENQAAEFEGTIVSEDDSTITLRVKKPRSSKYTVRMFMKNVLQYVNHYEDEDGNAWGYVRTTPHQTEATSVTGTITVADGKVTVVDEDGDEFIFNQGICQLSIEGEDEEGETKSKKTAKKATKKAEKKPAKKSSKKEEEDDDDEDDDDDEEEDEEEDEKPSKKSSKKPAKKSSKKEEEDDDDEDDDDDEEEDEGDDDDDWDE